MLKYDTQSSRIYTQPSTQIAQSDGFISLVALLEHLTILGNRQLEQCQPVLSCTKLNNEMHGLRQRSALHCSL